MRAVRAMCVAVVWASAFPAAVQAKSLALVVGIGAARHGDGTEGWRNEIRRSARVDAETAFRELVPAARAEPHLYSRPYRWEGSGGSAYDTAALLTDGVTDNRVIPLKQRVLDECSPVATGLSEDDDYVLFVSGIGESNGMRSWVSDRLGTPIPLPSLLEGIQPSGGRGRRVAVVRLYPVDVGEAPRTICLADPATAGRFREWLPEAARNVDAGTPPPDVSGLLPGLGNLVSSATPVRLRRMRERTDSAWSTIGPWIMVDFDTALERVTQEVRVPVDVYERPVYRKVRRPGPLFTIVEVETDIQIGVETTVDAADLQQRLAGQGLAPPVIAQALAVIDARAANSFEETLRIGRVEYSLRYDRAAGEVRIAYRD